MPDRFANARTMLLADTPVAAIVGTDIEVSRFDGAIPDPGLLLRPNGGASARSGTPKRAQSMETQAYSSSSVTAWALHEAARTALLGDPAAQPAHEATLRSFGLWQVLEEVEGQSLPIDPNAPDDGIFVVLGNFTLKSRDDA